MLEISLVSICTYRTSVLEQVEYVLMGYAKISWARINAGKQGESL